MKVDRNNGKIMSQKQKVELSGSKTEGIYDCFAAHLYCLWLTRWLLIDSFWIHFFKSVKGKLVCSGHEKTKTTFTQLLLILQLLVLFFFLYDNFVFIYLWIVFCSDINECVCGLHQCSSDAFCNDTQGSYNCTCRHGFTGNGRECKGRRWIH